MPRFATALCVVAALSVTGAIVRADDQELRMFSWLAGVWEEVGDGRTVEEHWTAPSDNTMVGMSRAVTGTRTTEFEFIRLEKRGADIFYVAQPGGRPPVAFKLTSTEQGRYVFENTSGEDRVNKIVYELDGSQLIARVEGASQGKPFELEYRYHRRR